MRGIATNELRGWVRVASALALGAFVAATLGGCRGGAPRAQVPAAGPPAATVLETVGDVAIVPLEAHGFERLAPADRVLAYYLGRAAIAGRDLAFDDGGAANLEIRDLLEEVLTHPRSLDPAFRDALLQYLKHFWIDNGNHDRITGMKFVPAFTYEALRAGARAAQLEGAEIRMAVGESLTGKLERLRPAIFDPSFEAAAACPGATAPVAAPAGASAAPAAAAEAAAEPRRARRAAALRTMTGFLAKAAARAPDAQRPTLELLSRAALDGGAAARAAWLDGWLRLEPPVDIAIDPGAGCGSVHGREGGWAGLVFGVDAETTRRLRMVAADGAIAATLLVGTGAAGPAVPPSIDIPESAVAGQEARRAILLTNVIEAADRAGLEPLVREFAAREDQAILLKHGKAASFALAALHAIPDHTAPAAAADSGTAPDAEQDDERLVLDEARADLRALDRMFDERLVAGGFLAGRADAEAALRLYLVRALAALGGADAEGRLGGAAPRAERLVASWLEARDGGVAQTRVDGRTTLRVTDVEAARRGVRALLGEIDRLLSDGGAQAARVFLERFANRAEPDLRAEIAGRASHAGVFSRTACLMPDLIPVRDAAGEVIDARVGPTADFTLQMLRASGKLPSAAEAR